MYKRRGGLKYFSSEYKLQIYLYKNKVISMLRLLINISVRFIVQVILINSLRSFIFKKIARNKIEAEEKNNVVYFERME